MLINCNKPLILCILCIDDLILFSVSFNDGQALNNIVFAPSSCKVVNKENTEESFQIWDSNFAETVPGMCDDTPNPVGFQIVQSPDDAAFYGMNYNGE